MTFFDSLLHSKRMRRASALAAILCICAGSLCAGPVGQNVGSADPKHYLDDVKELTEPAMEGRGDGTKGLTLAAHMLEKRYRQLGLKPAGSNSYFQPFTVITGAKLRSSRNRFTVDDAAQKRDLKFNQDFVPFSFSSSDSVTAPVVFVGYGATADEFSYDDYAGIDVKDKIVVALRYEPSGFADKAGNHGLTHHAQLITKAINARNHGAKALVLTTESWATARKIC